MLNRRDFLKATGAAAVTLSALKAQAADIPLAPNLQFPRYRPRRFREVGVTYNTLHAHCEYLETLVEEKQQLTRRSGLIDFVAKPPIALIVLMSTPLPYP